MALLLLVIQRLKMKYAIDHPHSTRCSVTWPRLERSRGYYFYMLPTVSFLFFVKFLTQFKTNRKGKRIEQNFRYIIGCFNVNVYNVINDPAVLF